MDTYKEKYNEALERARKLKENPQSVFNEYSPKEGDTICDYIFPELRESEDERIREQIIYAINKLNVPESEKSKLLAWLEKQGSEPNWCHHKVDLSNCSEEYRKAYYDGWNNCNQQHSQCKSESNDVIKCLINGMKFYYEYNEEATWGTEKFSMKVKDILSWLEKQGEKKPQRMISAEAKEAMYNKPAYAWSEEDEKIALSIEQVMNCASLLNIVPEKVDKIRTWLKSLKQRITP